MTSTVIKEMDTMNLTGYDLIDSPLGELLVAWTDRGIAEIGFAGSGRGHSLAEAGVPRSEHEQARAELAEFFAGKRRAFSLPLDLKTASPFSETVLAALAQVGYGQTVSYGELAAKIGRPGAARAVGRALNRNPLPLVVPCHRIVGAGGKLVGYAGGLERKRQLLELETTV